MSSILKALRKLEEEKAALGEGGVDIARDILKRSVGSSKKSLFWPLTSAVLFVLLLGGALFYVVVAFRQGSVPPANRVSDVDPVVQGPIIPLTPMGDVGSVVDVVVTKKNAVKTIPSPVVVPLANEVLAPQVVAAKTVSPEATRGDGLPFLKLTGIAYRENSAERIAIINDLPVMQGTAIEGAQVVEILPDRVLLQWQGKRFEQKVE